METRIDANEPTATPLSPATEEAFTWLERALPRIMRRLMGSDSLDMPLLQLPLAQIRLAHALYSETDNPDMMSAGETMGRLSERLGVRHNALTQVADRLINHGLAERLSDSQDRRVVRLRLTEQGREWVSARRTRRRAHLRQLWSELEPQEREDFLHAVHMLETVGARLEAQAPGTKGTLEEPEKAPLTIEETLSHFTAGTVGA